MDRINTPRTSLFDKFSNDFLYLVIGGEADTARRVEVLPLLPLEAVALDELPGRGEQLDPVVPGIRDQNLVLKTLQLQCLLAVHYTRQKNKEKHSMNSY